MQIKHFKYFSSLIVMQVVLLALIILQGSKLFDLLYISPLITKLGVIIIFTSTVWKSYQLANQSVKRNYTQLRLKEKEKFITKLKRQKHEFFECLQTIRGMVELRNDEKVKEYIDCLDQKLKPKTTSESKKEFIESTLVPLRIKAEEENIDFNYQLDRGVENVDCSVDRLARIIFYLVESIIKITRECKDKNIVNIEGNEGENEYLVSVYNGSSDKKIKLDDTNFDLDTSIKKTAVKLDIINFLVNRLGEEIKIKNEENKVQFICCLPKE